MKIVFQANQILPVKSYGGTERIIFWLMCHLKQLGHQPILIGNPKSKVEEYGIKLIPFDPKIDESWEKLVPNDADLIHLGYNYRFKLIDKPCLFTIHGNGQIGELFPKNSVFVSKKHAQNHGCESFIYNGINFDEYPLQKIPPKKWNDFLFLAKASWRIKNLKSCLKACKKAHKNLHIVGGKSWIPSRYIKNYGFMGGVEKNQIIQSCDALLFPVKWEEPFGLAIIEAMAYGLPVIGSSYGSLPELIPSFAGKICENENELFENVLNKQASFNSQMIAEYARSTFTSFKMTQEYIQLYEKICSGEIINTQQPSWIFSDPASKLKNF